MKKISIILIIPVIIFIVLYGISLKGESFPDRNFPFADKSKIMVTASFYPIYFFSSEIGGERAAVWDITPAGSQPHEYEPTAQDIARITQSKMFVLNGGMIDAWGDKIKDELKGNDVVVVHAGAGLTKSPDPHYWLDPVLAKEMAANIEKGFAQIDEKDTSIFKKNLRELDGKLDRLDAEYRQGLSKCGRSDFITSHTAFAYLAARYGLNQIAISGISPDEEPSSRKLTEIADLVRKENIKVIFFESLASPRLSETIAQETGAETLVLDPVEGISESSIKAGKDYFSAMRQNLVNLKKALQCTG